MLDGHHAQMGTTVPVDREAMGRQTYGKPVCEFGLGAGERDVSDNVKLDALGLHSFEVLQGLS